MFSDAEIRQKVLDVVNAPDVVPPGHRGAFLVVADKQGARAVIAAKVNDVWQVDAIADHPWKAGLDYGVNVRAVW